MPIASAGPAPPDNRHLAVTSLSRNDSLKSERSDKRVSFNNDVGIKHIPRGATKQQAPHAPPQKAPPDEWDKCKPVKLQPTKLTAEELEREAANLVDLVDSINCKASPLPSKKHKDFTSRSLDRSQKRTNNSRNGLSNGLNYTRITNPIIKHLKADVNRRDNRRRDVYSDSDSDRNRTARHKSVPNLVAASSYNNNNNSNSRRLYNGIEPSLNYTSVDNLLDEKNTNIIHAGKEPRPLYNSTSHHSADNLLDAPAERSNLIGFKSLGSLPHVTDSDSTDMSYGYRPKVNQIIQRLNGDSDHQRYRSTDLSSDRESSPSRAVIAPTRRQRHNHNKPFSYTEPKQVASLQAVRQSSPSRDLNSDDMYAQVNKHGLRQRLSMDSDYSAKIIITEDRPRNAYEGDDEAYETYQVQNNSLRNNRFSDYGLNLSRDDINSKNTAMNNNINMSSVAVQTDQVNKALNKDRRTAKGMAPQPPTNEPYRENYRSRKALSSELPSADLVRQVNHGFGRFDRSPSPPPRKAFNRSNPRHVIPLLSDTSDSEPEYRRRSDPLAKIRNQVLMGERLQEEHDAEEWEEREMAQYERDKRNPNYNPSGMRPLTIDEVEALSLELDQHGDRKLVVSQKSGEKRSSSQQTAHQSSYTHESHGERSYSEDRSRPIKPLREKSQSNRDSSESRQLTLERNKKNNIEKEKLAQEKKAKEIEKENEKQQEKDTLKSSKGKDKKVKEPKEKKKKRIKIKFFYDPRPQDKTPEDPLKRYTEYKGTDRKEVKQEKVTTSKTARSRSYDSRSQSRERRETDDPPTARDSSRERTLSRPDRSRKPASSTTRLHLAGSGNDPSSHEDSNDDRRRVRSTDSYDKRDRYGSRVNYDSRDDRRTKYEYDDKFDRNPKRYVDVDDRDKRYDSNRRPINDRDSHDRDRNRYDDYSDHQRDEAAERRNTFLERRELYERRDSSVGRRDSRDTRKDSTDRSYTVEKRGLYRDDEPDRARRYEGTPPNGPATNGPGPAEDKNTSSPDEDGKQERVLRQRKKFLSAFMSDGRAKSSNVSSTTTKTGGAISAPKDTSYSNNTSSSTLKRSQSSVQDVKEWERSPLGDTAGHESDPPPSLAPAALPTDSPKNKQSSKNAKKKKKKKSWSWGFLGLRSNRRKKGVPASGAGSEVGSVAGGATPRRGGHSSRPTSRASSHRSSTRPTRPSVRASKIRKDAGEGRSWSSRANEQRETTRRWESATLQRPAGLASRDRDRRDRDQSDDRHGRLNARGPRRTSEGSSGSSAGPPRNASNSRVDRTASSKQRYFGDSDHEPPRPRNSGPGDYRSLPNRTTRATTGTKRGARAGGGGGSAGSSLQSSESENDSHQGSRASHVSTGSNRSVYLHAMAVADIPVQKDGETSDKPGVQRQTRKVTRSFSLLAPWKPKHAREPHNIEYDNKETKHAAKPPRPPRRSADNVGRSQTLTNKDSKLSGWLKKRKSKEGKGI